MMTPDTVLWENQERIRRTINRPADDPQRAVYARSDRATRRLGFGLHRADDYAAAMKGGATS